MRNPRAARRHDAPIHVAGGRSSFRFGHGPTRDVRVVTLDSVLADASPFHVDFISIDVEGSEFDVLLGFSFERYRPGLVLLEDLAEGLEKHRFMRARGYKRVRRTGNNSWYVPQDVAFPGIVAGQMATAAQILPVDSNSPGEADAEAIHVTAPASLARCMFARARRGAPDANARMRGLV